MINIRMFNEQWQIKLGDEIWQFSDRKEMLKVLDTICELKEKYGKVKGDRNE